MDFSIKKVQNKNDKQINFKGAKGDLNAKNEQVFRFSTPSHKHDEEVHLVLSLLVHETNENGQKKSNNYISKATAIIPFRDKTTLEFPQDKIREKGIEALGYEYLIKSKDGSERTVLDAFKKVKLNGVEKNIIEIGNAFGITPDSGSARHSFVDSDGIDCENLTPVKRNFRRNHFNKLGGSLKGLTILLKKGFFEGVKYILSTPDIGADPTSPHKYWPNNQYQCTNIEDFKELNFELFKKGKGYIADGAFTSQSLQSPLVQHVLKWGEESPFRYMLKMDRNPALGVIPESETAYQHTGIKLINPPNSPKYDRSKPTLMQFFDDRTTSEKLQKDTTKLIDKYDIPNPEDSYDIISYQDSVHPFYFEISVNEIDKKLAIIQKSALRKAKKEAREEAGKTANINTAKTKLPPQQTVMLKDLTSEELDDILSVGTGKIVNRYHAAQVTCWDGNVDIIKMNLSNPNLSNPRDVEGFFNARNYLFGVATYWTEAVQSNLIFETSKLSENEIRSIAKKNGITKQDFEIIKNNINNPETKFPVLQQNKTIGNYLDEFALQTIETSPELSAVFSEPEFNKELLKGSIRDYVIETVNNAINQIIPEEYKNNEEYKTYAVKVAANEILKQLFVKSMSNDAVKADGTIDLAKLKNVTLKSLLPYTPTTPKDERDCVVSAIRKGLKKQNVNEVISKLQKEFKNISLEDFKLADSVVLQGKGGLNWRFDASKDIGDLSAISNKQSTFNEIWNGTQNAPGVQQFWREFIRRIKTYNPSSYIIAEVTNFGDMLGGWNNLKAMLAFDEKITNTYIDKVRQNIKEVDGENTELSKLSDIFANTTKNINERHEAFEKAKEIMDKNKDKYEIYANYEFNVPYSKEQEFIEQIGATTPSNYDKYFNNLSKFAGVDPEHGNDARRAAGNLEILRNNSIKLMKFSQPNTVLLSHVFVDNHDKPRLLHTLPLDMNLYVKSLKGGSVNDVDDATKVKITALTGRIDYKNMDSQAVAVGLMLKEKIEDIYSSSPKKSELLETLKDFTNGTKNGRFSIRRARGFGSAPYEVTVKQIFNKAGIKDDDEIEKFLFEIQKESLDLQEKSWQMMNALMGVSTMYYGTEYGQTGYETSSKNVLWGNRNRALHERENKGPFVDYCSKMNAISSLSNNLDLTALKNGFPEYLKIDSKEGIDFLPIYRKDEFNSEVLSVITNYGIEKNQLSKDHKIRKDIVEVDSVKIKDDKDYCPFDEGQILSRMVYNPADKKYVKENVEYKVINGTIQRKDGKPIEISDAVATFFVDRPRAPKFVPVYNTAH